MAFDYGKDTLGIKNPFKFEGFLVLIKGILITILGIILIFHVRATIGQGLKLEAWVEMAGAILFLGLGLNYAVKGGMKLFRFLVGRSVPANLHPDYYTSDEIKDMLMKRLNPTFKEKNSYVSRLVISLFHHFLFLPIGFRNIAEGITSAALETLIALGMYLLAIFSTSIGLISLTDADVVMQWLGLILIIYLFVIWYRYRPGMHRINTDNPRISKIPNMVMLVLAAVLIPFLIEFLIVQGFDLPAITVPITLHLVLILLFSAATIVVTFMLCNYRAKSANPETAVSEYKEHLQFSMHPRDLFRCFELEMTNKRYKEIPNREYIELNPVLTLEGSQNKGSFYGDNFLETQPVYKETEYPKSFYTTRMMVAVAGHAFTVIAFLILFFKILNLPAELSLQSIYQTLFFPLLLFLFSEIIVLMVHYFYSEILFKSFLVHFFAEGTYTESRVSTGMSVYDSNRSENTVVRTSATPWLLVSEIISSTFSDSTTNNLEGKRYVMEMYKADGLRDEIVNGIKYYLNNQEMLANIDSKKDLDNTAKYFKINEATRGKISDNPEKFNRLDADDQNQLEEPKE